MRLRFRYEHWILSTGCACPGKISIIWTQIKCAYREILLAMGYKSFEYRSFVFLLLAHCSHVSPISRYGEVLFHSFN